MPWEEIRINKYAKSKIAIEFFVFNFCNQPLLTQKFVKHIFSCGYHQLDALHTKDYKGSQPHK